MRPALSIWAGARAFAQLTEQGWHPDLFSTMLGASGGPKWLVLSGLDRVLYRGLLEKRTAPLDLVASSIGSWRHAALSSADPIEAIARFESAYLEQTYATKPAASEVSQVATDILFEMLGAEGVSPVIEHSLFRNHIVTARARGLAGSTGNASITLGMVIAAINNAIDRRRLPTHFQRVVFSAAPAALPNLLTGFETTGVSLTASNLVPALKASGAIPLVLEAERNIQGAPLGCYWDGGIIDYHFELPAENPTSHGKVILFPHFTDTLTPGWFDKFLPWRSARAPRCQDLILLCPSREFVASLPFGKIPDRGDFKHLSDSERKHYWQTCLSASRALGDEFAELIQGDDPVKNVRRIDL